MGKGTEAYPECVIATVPDLTLLTLQQVLTRGKANEPLVFCTLFPVYPPANPQNLQPFLATSQNETRQLPLLIVFYCQVSCEVVSFLYTFKRKTTCYKAVIYSSTVVCITCASQLSKTQICLLTFYYVTTDKNGHLS